MPSSSGIVSAGSSDGNDNAPSTVVVVAENENFRHFIRKMIEIKNILRMVDLDGKIELPSIVVIGSQSSGKSSVLESIVGHEFLPKGQNMVTRRPLELTLVHSPNTARDYGVLHGKSNAPIYDFHQIQSMLQEENLNVPDNQWVSSEPIELTIYSKNVPDLTLIDLPGYIQVTSRSQPPVLREKIAELCERYIQGNENIILAVCPADVDMANAEALKASKKVDPNGDRTIGVITKMDLVDPEYGATLLSNDEYPLKLGYIGVVCKPIEGIRSRLLSDESKQLSKSHSEDIYFNENSSTFRNLNGHIGMKSLRRNLTSTLENNITSNLSSILYKVNEELSNVRYQLKVEYNDRIITPEGYVTSLLNNIKIGFEQITLGLTRKAVKWHVDAAMEEHFVQVVEKYLAEPEISKDENILEERLRMSLAALSKSGIGKKTVGVILDNILENMEDKFDKGILVSHPDVKNTIVSELTNQLQSKAVATADMVENALKPYKQDFEFDPADWYLAKEKAFALLEGRLRKMSERIEMIQSQVGHKRLRKALQYLAKNGFESIAENPTMSDSALDVLLKSKEVAELYHRQKVLKRRLDYLRNESNCDNVHGFWSQFKTFFTGQQNGSSIEEPCIRECPEVFLYLIHERLSNVSSLFVYHEIVQEFLEPFPAQISSSLLESNLAHGTRSVAMRYVQENPQVFRHLQLLERRAALEKAREKLIYLKQRKEEQEDMN